MLLSSSEIPRGITVWCPWRLSCGILWLQKFIASGSIILRSISGNTNPADVGTKRLSAGRMKSLTAVWACSKIRLVHVGRLWWHWQGFCEGAEHPSALSLLQLQGCEADVSESGWNTMLIIFVLGLVMILPMVFHDPLSPWIGLQWSHQGPCKRWHFWAPGTTNSDAMRMMISILWSSNMPPPTQGCLFWRQLLITFSTWNLVTGGNADMDVQSMPQKACWLLRGRQTDPLWAETRCLAWGDAGVQKPRSCGKICCEPDDTQREQYLDRCGPALASGDCDPDPQSDGQSRASFQHWITGCRHHQRK